MDKKISLDTDEETSEEGTEEVEIGSVLFPHVETGRSQIRRIQDIMKETGTPPKPVFKERKVIKDTRKGVEDLTVPAPKKRTNTKKEDKKEEKPNRRF